MQSEAEARHDNGLNQLRQLFRDNAECLAHYQHPSASPRAAVITAPWVCHARAGACRWDIRPAVRGLPRNLVIVASMPAAFTLEYGRWSTATGGFEPRLSSKQAHLAGLRALVVCTRTTIVQSKPQSKGKRRSIMSR